MVNWFGYASTVSPYAIEEFEKETGRKVTPEDFVDNGRYNTPFKNPTEFYLEWMDFNSKFVSELAKKCVDLVHKYNKKAIMFLGDHWAGCEPYGKYFQNIGLDAVVGAAGDGVTTRMIADIPIEHTEARFYPYFFPDIFHEGGDPVGESMPIWIKCRRAMMINPTDRMGYGGYLSLALKFPEFIDHVTEITRQFKAIHENRGEIKKAPFKVAMLNSWGKIKAWQTHQVAHSLWNQRCYSYLGVMEALAGFAIDIDFINFDDVKAGRLDEFGVVINMGDAGTAWSGADNWADTEVIEKLRAWIYAGGGFIGIGEPSAYNRDGHLFQLSDCLGVQKEIGLTASFNKPAMEIKKHFITADVKDSIDYGEGMSMVYTTGDTDVLDIQSRSANLTAHTYGKGRTVYIAGMPYNNTNARIIERAMYWSASCEEQFCAADNENTELYVYPDVNKACINNNSDKKQKTSVCVNGKEYSFELDAMASEWFDI